MSSVALVSVLGPDRVGLVAAISDHLFNAGVNLRDTTFAALGSGAEFVALCELPDGVTASAIDAGLIKLPELEGAEIRAGEGVLGDRQQHRRDPRLELPSGSGFAVKC
jgi:glycine cleavage system transcriptional repressor